MSEFNDGGLMDRGRSVGAGIGNASTGSNGQGGQNFGSVFGTPSRNAVGVGTVPFRVPSRDQTLQDRQAYGIGTGGTGLGTSGSSSSMPRPRPLATPPPVPPRKPMARRAVNPVTGQTITTYADTLPAGFQVVPAGYLDEVINAPGWTTSETGVVRLEGTPMEDLGFWGGIKSEDQISPDTQVPTGANPTMHNHSDTSPGYDMDTTTGPEDPGPGLRGDESSFGGPPNMGRGGQKRQFGGPVSGPPQGLLQAVQSMSQTTGGGGDFRLGDWRKRTGIGGLSRPRT